jgi:hypothetical protein
LLAWPIINMYSVGDKELNWICYLRWHCHVLLGTVAKIYGNFH